MEVNTSSSARIVLSLTGLLLLLPLSLLLPNCAPKPAETKTETLKLIVFSRPSPLVLGEAKGFFAAEGIKLDITQTRSSTEQIRGILDGTWDIAHTSPDNVIAYVESEGADLSIFSGLDHGLKMSLFTQPNIKSIKDLKGKTLGVDALATGFAFVLRKMLLVNGLDLNKKDYELLAVGGTAQRYQALKEGKIVGALLTPPWDDQAKQEGFNSLVAAGDIMDSYLSTVWAGRRAWAKDHSDLLVRFLRAYVKSVDWATNPSNHKEAVSLVAKDQNISEEVAARRFDQEMDPATGAIPKAALDLKGLDTVIKLRAEMGFLKPPIPSADKYYDLTYYNRAVKK